MAIATLTSTESGANSLTDINANFADLDTTKADLASPTFTGTPTLPTGTIAVTQSNGDSSTKVATTAFVAAATAPITIETTSGVTHSLTTTAGQKVVVWAKGVFNYNNTLSFDIKLNYNGVQKDICTVNISTSGATFGYPFALMYTEIPGAGTQNITVTTSAGSLTNVVIIVMKQG
jgi:hypothetical protein